MNIIIQKTPPNEAPMDLILEADESMEAISDYLYRGEVYCAYMTNCSGHYGNDPGQTDKPGGTTDAAYGILVGVSILLKTRPFTMELVNLAVKEDFRRRGIARRLIENAEQVAREAECRVLEVGTGNIGYGQIALYQQCGFSMTGIDTDFFRKYYPDPVFDNGQECRHMIRFSMEL